ESIKVALPPTCTLPKLRLKGLALSRPGVGLPGAVVPTPLSGRTSAEPEVEIKRLPPSAPTDCGAKVTVNLTLCPAPSVKGNAGPLIENPNPVVCTADRVTFQERVFVSTTGTV